MHTIHTYTRKQAIEDGVLIDVSPMAREAGIKFPVAITARLWHEYIVPREVDEKQGQSTNGRLWDVLFMFAIHARNVRGSLIKYRVGFVNHNNQVIVTVKAVIGPGDTWDPVVTLMLQDED